MAPTKHVAEHKCSFTDITDGKTIMLHRTPHTRMATTSVAGLQVYGGQIWWPSMATKDGSQVWRPHMATSGVLAKDDRTAAS
jgi:hypothetical protein